LYTREEFEDLRIQSARKMATDEKLGADALDVLVRADKYSWIHQTNWLGEPALQLPQDMFAMQEIIYASRPDYIIEAGVAWGGSLLFYSTLFEVIGGKKVIGIDTYIPQDLRDRLYSHGRVSKRIILISGSSVDPAVIKKLTSIVRKSKRVLAILDSNHTRDHVLSELRIYSRFVGKGHYIVCGDTVIEDIPEQKHRPRPWGHGNSPKTAVEIFLKEDEAFTRDTALENKLLFTCNPGGYLVKKKD